MYRGNFNLFLQKQNMYGGSLHIVDTEESCEPFVLVFFPAKKALSVYSLYTLVICCIQGFNYKLFSTLLMNLESGKEKKPPSGYGF